MKDIPIIYSAPMVRALWGDRKFMTRRLAWRQVRDKLAGQMIDVATPWQSVKPGDRLWVREALANSQAGWTYKVDGWLIEMSPRDPRVAAMVAWAHHKEGDHAPSIHMPRWASRLTLIVTATKIERLQDISEKDARAEGLIQRDWMTWDCPGAQGGIWHTAATGKDCFMWLWRKLHGEASWDADPEVVALTFQVHKSNIDSLPKAEAA